MMTNTSHLKAGPPVEFWSSVEYATFQKGLIRELRSSGWEASDRFQVSQADYWAARSRMARLSLRAKTYALYPMALAARFSAARTARIGVVCTNTFYAPFLAACTARRDRTRMVHWVFDLFPDVLLLAGVIREGGWQEKVLRSLVRRTFDRASVNVFLGERLRAYAESRFGPIPRSVVIPVGCDARPFSDAEPVATFGRQPLRVLYCGNYGRMHDIDTVVGMLREGAPEGVQFSFRGNGPGFRTLETALPSAKEAGRVAIGGNMGEDEWSRVMRQSEVALVTMKKGAEAVVMPSKTYSAMAAGQALLAICPQESDLADTVRKHACGWVVEPGNQAELRMVLERIRRDQSEVQACRLNAWRAGQAVYDQSALVKDWMNVFEAAWKHTG